MNRKPRFTILFLQDVKDFLDKLQVKPRDKIFFNIWKTQSVNDDELFKKLSGEIWEFRTIYNNIAYRLFAFWDKTENAVVVTTHGIIKKTNKIPKKEIEKANKIRIEYLKLKKK